MGEVGRWDPVLFARYRAAREGSARQRMLLGELIRIHTPLIKTLVAQVQGRPPPEHLRGRVRTGMRLPGADKIDWETALQMGRFAATKAFAGFDRGKGTFAVYLVRKIYYELQCILEKESAVLRLARGQAPPPTKYLKSEEHLDWLRSQEDAFDVDPETAFEAEELESGVHLAAAAAPEEEVPRLEVAMADTRSALEVLLEDHLTFRPAARAAASSVHGRYRNVALERGEFARPQLLTRALRERGARTTSLRVEWSSTPVWGFAGVSLQSAARAPSLQKERACFSSESRAISPAS